MTRLSAIPMSKPGEPLIVANILIEKIGQKTFLKRPSLPLEDIPLVAADHLARIREFDPAVVLGTRKPITRVGVLLEGVDESGLLLHPPEGIEILTAQHILLRDNDVNMRLPLHQSAGLPVEDAFDPGKMGFGVEVEFIGLKGCHREAFEVSRDRMKGFRRNFVFLEGERNMEIAVAPLVHAVDEGVGQFKIAVQNDPLIEFIAGLLPALLLPVFQIVGYP